MGRPRARRPRFAPHIKRERQRGRISGTKTRANVGLGGEQTSLSGLFVSVSPAIWHPHLPPTSAPLHHTSGVESGMGEGNLRSVFEKSTFRRIMPLTRDTLVAGPTDSEAPCGVRVGIAADACGVRRMLSHGCRAALPLYPRPQFPSLVLSNACVPRSIYREWEGV
ncbi:hypothetical protein BJV78DRAFT_81329 [Lactifluus subvellereus]|nr:hypothetical protein BJV78DRAFT_81329 [Lactifluus subvellereus]